jgi:uncharacterized membrane protein YciS (DUF1049 family)
MYIPPFNEYAEFALGFLIGWFLMDLARKVYRYVKLLWLRRNLKRDLKNLEQLTARFKEEIAKMDDSNKT